MLDTLANTHQPLSHDKSGGLNTTVLSYIALPLKFHYAVGNVRAVRVLNSRLLALHQAASTWRMPYRITFSEEKAAFLPRKKADKPFSSSSVTRVILSHIGNLARPRPKYFSMQWEVVMTRKSYHRGLWKGFYSTRKAHCKRNGG